MTIIRPVMHFLSRPAVRVALALAWTLFLTVLLVQPSGDPVIGPPAPPGQPTPMRELLLMTAHLVTFAVLVLVWRWALVPYLSQRGAMFVAVGFALIFGALTEFAQNFSANRDPSLFDVATDWFSTGVVAVICWLRQSG